MAFRAVAFDFDGTLAIDGRVASSTLKALRQLSYSGRRLLLVTGRQLEDLEATFNDRHLFDLLVLENGGILVEPSSGSVQPLASPPSPRFVESLRSHDVKPLTVGRTIVATGSQHRHLVERVIAELGLSLAVTLNNRALMVLPRGVDKGTGLASACGRLGLPLESVIGVGDAQNDVPMLAACGFGVAVANAIYPLRAAADWVTSGSSGDGVVELIGRVLEADVFLTRSPARL